MTPEQIQEIRKQYGYNPSTINLSSQDPQQSEDTNKRLQTILGNTETSSESSPNLLQTIAGGILKGSSRAGQTFGAGAIAAKENINKPFLGALSGDFQKSYQDASKLYDKSGELLGNTLFGEPVKPAQNLEQAAGDAIQTAANFIPGSGIAKNVAGLTGSKIAGNVVAGLATGYGMDVGSSMSNNESVKDTLTPGAGTVIGGAIPTLAPFLTGAGRAISKTGAKLVDAVIPTSSREATILQSYRAENPFFTRVADVLKGTEKAPQTAAKTTVETTAGQLFPGLFGTKSQIGVQAKRASNSLWNDLIKPSLDNSGTKVDLPTYFNTIEEQIIKDNPEIARQKALLEALQSVKDDYKGIQTVDLSKLQELKEGWAQFVPQKYYNGKDIAGATGEVNALLADQARNTIYDALGKDVKQAYFDYGNLKGLQELGKTAMTGQKLKGGAGSFITELLSEAVTPVATVAGQTLYRVGKGIEFIGKTGARFLNEALGTEDNALNQEAKAPIKTQSSQTPKIINNISNIDSSIAPTVNKSSGKLGGFAQFLKETPDGKLKGKILPDDADAVVDFANVVNGEDKVNDATYLAMRKEIKGIAKTYGVKGKTDREIVDALQKKIYNDYHKFPGFTELGLLPKLAIGTAIGAGGIKIATSKNK